MTDPACGLCNDRERYPDGVVIRGCPVHDPPKWADLFGIDPAFSTAPCGGSAVVDEPSAPAAECPCGHDWTDHWEHGCTFPQCGCSRRTVVGSESYRRQVIFDAIQDATDAQVISAGAFLDSLERDHYEVRYVGPGDEPT